MNINMILKRFSVDADCISYSVSDFIISFCLRLNNKQKFSKIISYKNEIAAALGAREIDIKFVNGLVECRCVLKKNDNVVYKTKKDMSVYVGKSVFGQEIYIPLQSFPHLLISGATGSGKSVFLHSFIASMIDSDNVQLALIDPKYVEFFRYRNIKQLYDTIPRDNKEALALLAKIEEEMQARFLRLLRHKVSSIQEYNKKNKKQMSYLVVVVDEFADLMYFDKKRFSSIVARLSQKSRACGIHIVIATQRPSTDIVNGTIKANFSTRIAFRLPSAIDSRVVLGRGGAENLEGKGEGILMSEQYSFEKFQAPFLSQSEIKEIVNKNNTSIVKKIWRWVNVGR